MRTAGERLRSALERLTSGGDLEIAERMERARTHLGASRLNRNTP